MVYKVVRPLKRSNRVFKPYKPIGSQQSQLSNGNSIFPERYKFCELNDKLILNKVILLCSGGQTIIAGHCTRCSCSCSL